MFPSLGQAVRVARGYAACDGGGRWRVYGTRVFSVGVIGEWVTLDRELHPFEALELATVIEAVKLEVLHGWPRWWAWTFASLVAQIAIGILEAAAGELVIVDHDVGETIH